jgi:acyl-CoA reductase-like NAD-dependent aldehyde dehydrogenase
MMELGGKSAHIVLDDAKFECLPMAAMVACVMSGQACVMASRILLPRSRYDEGIEILKASMEGRRSVILGSRHAAEPADQRDLNDRRCSV